MARVTYGSLITELRGSIGGTVFQRNKYGYTAKNTPNMVKPKSSSVRLNQRLLIAATQGWRSLSDSQRALFNSYASTYPQYAKHNPVSALSGYSIFVKWWFILGQCGYSLPDSPDLVAVSNISINPSLNMDGADCNFLLGNTIISGTLCFAYYLSSIYPASQTFPPSNLRYISNVQQDSEPATINDIYSSIFGFVPSIGDIIFCRIVPFDLLSPVVFAEQFYKLTVTF